MTSSNPDVATRSIRIGIPGATIVSRFHVGDYIKDVAFPYIHSTIVHYNSPLQTATLLSCISIPSNVQVTNSAKDYTYAKNL